MELRHKFDLNLLLNQTNMARSNFYYHQKKTKSADKYQVIKELIKSIYHKHKGRYGYRRITDELQTCIFHARYAFDEKRMSWHTHRFAYAHVQQTAKASDTWRPLIETVLLNACRQWETLQEATNSVPCKQLA